MKKILKRQSPEFFDTWKTGYQTINGRAPTYSDLIGETKHRLKEELYEEQYGLCCYCCKAVQYPYPNSEESHIEHFRPKGVARYDSLSLEYTNLHLSCSGYKGKRDSCGHKKEDWFDESLTVSPLEDGVEELFTYTVEGHIRPMNGNMRADATIRGLELNTFSLQRLRKTAIYISGLFDDDFNQEKRERILNEYNTPVEGKLRSFCNAVMYCVTNA